LQFPPCLRCFLLFMQWDVPACFATPSSAPERTTVIEYVVCGFLPSTIPFLLCLVVKLFPPPDFIRTPFLIRALDPLGYPPSVTQPFHERVAFPRTHFFFSFLPHFAASAFCRRRLFFTLLDPPPSLCLPLPLCQTTTSLFLFLFLSAIWNWKRMSYDSSEPYSIWPFTLHPNFYVGPNNTLLPQRLLILLFSPYTVIHVQSPLSSLLENDVGTPEQPPPAEVPAVILLTV